MLQSVKSFMVKLWIGCLLLGAIGLLGTLTMRVVGVKPPKMAAAYAGGIPQDVNVDNWPSSLGTPTKTSTPTATVTPGGPTATPTSTFTPIPIVRGTIAQRSLTPTPVTTPRAGYITGVELLAISNGGTVGDNCQWAVGNSINYGPFIAANGQDVSVPRILWDNGTSNIGFIPQSQATTMTYSYRLLYWPMSLAVPSPLGLPSKPGPVY